MVGRRRQGLAQAHFPGERGQVLGQVGGPEWGQQVEGVGLWRVWAELGIEVERGHVGGVLGPR